MMNLDNRKSSTEINNQNKMVLAVVLNHKIYSTKSVNKKYNNPMAKNNIAPLRSSLR